jgi:hypothetical protein
MLIVGVSLLVSVLTAASLRLLYYRNETFFLLCSAVERLFKNWSPRFMHE